MEISHSAKVWTNRRKLVVGFIEDPLYAEIGRLDIVATTRMTPSCGLAEIDLSQSASKLGTRTYSELHLLLQSEHPCLPKPSLVLLPMAN